jgi:hypothetical protein
MYRRDGENLTQPPWLSLEGILQETDHIPDQFMINHDEVDNSLFKHLVENLVD